ncbi:nuclear transport factor 2 family protein [Luteibaculum oceani]|uniref:Nuclear transport factor 2 family protein n=1 Tax=Luteibaculum oceani TaxID=1294296 RepID=A0A5C6VEB6_9FLAO|nr:nuclear transport factor 2 family protein [Luteibaculum oceani]TXC82145.1 nuclear transport factor 2 family protein [Luteibaculum oceani]
MRITKIIFILLTGLLWSCQNGDESTVSYSDEQTARQIAYLDSTINKWHLDAANADLESYFSVCSEDFVFLGTDSSERWSKEMFYSFSKPYFDRGKAWAFEPVARYWNFNQDHTIAWFDEQLDTWMKDCRGSGVMEYSVDNGWKLKHYNLSMTIYNEIVDDVLVLKSSFNQPDSTIHQ